MLFKYNKHLNFETEENYFIKLGHQDCNQSLAIFELLDERVKQAILGIAKKFVCV